MGSPLPKRSPNLRVISLIVVVALFCSRITFAREPATPAAQSQALWISNTNSDDSFISELVDSQLVRSGIPRASLNTGHSNVGPVGKIGFDGAGNLWIPFCGDENLTYGLVAAFSPAALAKFAAGDRRVKPIAELTGAAFNCPIALAFDHSGNLWVENAGFFDHPGQSIIEYTAASLSQNGSAPIVTLTSNSFRFLRGIAFDGAGDLWIANPANDANDGVLEFTPQQLSDGGLQTPGLILQSSLFINPHDIAFDTANNIWVAYDGGSPQQPSLGGVQMVAAANLTGSGTVAPPAAVTLSGQGQTPCILSVCTPSALAFDQSGDLWIASRTIAEFTAAQLTSGDPSIPQVILAPNFVNAKGTSLNFLGAGSLTFGPATK